MTKTEAYKIARARFGKPFVVAASVKGGRTYGFQERTERGIRTYQSGSYRDAVDARRDAIERHVDRLMA